MVPQISSTIYEEKREEKVIINFVNLSVKLTTLTCTLCLLYTGDRHFQKFVTTQIGNEEEEEEEKQKKSPCLSIHTLHFIIYLSEIKTHYNRRIYLASNAHIV